MSQDVSGLSGMSNSGPESDGPEPRTVEEGGRPMADDPSDDPAGGPSNGPDAPSRTGASAEADAPSGAGATAPAQAAGGDVSAETPGSSGDRPPLIPRVPPGLFGALRRALVPAIIVGVLVAIPVGIVGYVVGSAQDLTYSSSAIFRVVAKAPEIDSVSTNPRLTAEQSMRVLRDGRAEEYADRAAAGEEYSAEWVLGPGPDEISYKITADDPDTARKIADGVYQAAGYAGANLRQPGGPRTLLFGTGVTAPADNQPSAATMAGVAAIGAGGTATLLVLLVAVRPRRPR